MIQIDQIKKLDELSNYLNILKVEGYIMTREQAEKEIEGIENSLKELNEVMSHQLP